MEPDRVRSTLGLRRFGRNSFQYSLLLTSTLSTKFLHLYGHSTSLPILLYLLYMPTFLALDVFNALLFWVIVHLAAPARFCVLLSLARTIFSVMILGASSVQIAFYMETGAEIKWKAARSLASDPDGFKVALTGGVQAIFVAVLIVAVAFTVSQPLYDLTQKLFTAVAGAFGGQHSRNFFASKEIGSSGFGPCSTSASSGLSDDSDSDCLTSIRRSSVEATPLLVDIGGAQSQNLWLRRLALLAPAAVVFVLFTVRPTHFPYAHMSGSLPYTLAEIWNPFDTDICDASHFDDFPTFPLEELVAEDFWEPSNGRYVGWRPVANMTAFIQSERHMKRPSWLPQDPIQGLERWYQPPHEEHIEVTSKGKTSHPGPGPRPPFPGHPSRGPPPYHHHRFAGFNYDPVTDPMRVSNLDHDVLSPITSALEERNIKIKHIVLLALESTRKDVFPFKEGSHLHNLIMKTHGTDGSASITNESLAKLTETAEILTGESSGFGFASNSSANPGSWRALATDRGGLNIQGGMTGSTTSLKSMLESHCGVQPLAVDFTVEARRQIYQPCIPSILKLFNMQKTAQSHHMDRANGFDFTNMPWRSVYVQAITDQFDHQDELNEHVGFDDIVVKNTLLDPKSTHFPPTEKQSNYFGFPETQVKPYIEDAFRQARKEGERVFLSHLTSTTHHPWNLPEGSKSIQYLKQGRWRREHELNRYLNTIKYVDGWIAEIMDLLEKMEVVEDTLVVMVGDHGMAFEEDSPVHTTYENGHISNLKVPLNFFHPALPRMQLQVNATSLSIIPTILDLLVTTSSLDKADKVIASDLMQQYEGQSLIRPYIVRKNGRQAWNVAVLNAGGAVLSVSSSAFPYRLVMPICKAEVYRFTSNDVDPNELQPIEANSVADLVKKAAKLHGEEAGHWLEQAEKIGKYWILEQRRRWRFDGATLQDDRSPEELDGAGVEKKEHWWDT